MRELSAWHYLVIMTVPFGIFLSLRFGILGLSVFSLFNLAICYFCPDDVLQRNNTISANHKKPHLLENPYKTQEATYGLTLILPIISLILVWIFSPEAIATFVLQYNWVDIVNDNIQMRAKLIVDPQGMDLNAGNHTLQRLDRMQDFPPRLLMYEILNRIMIFFFLPLLIALSTFERTQDKRIRALYEPTHPQGLLLINPFRAAIGFFLLFIGFNYFLGISVEVVADYQSRLNHNYWDIHVFLFLVLGPLVMLICWMGLFIFPDSLLAIIRTSQRRYLQYEPK